MDELRSFEKSVSQMIIKQSVVLEASLQSGSAKTLILDGGPDCNLTHSIRCKLYVYLIFFLYSSVSVGNIFF